MSPPPVSTISVEVLDFVRATSLPATDRTNGLSALIAGGILSSGIGTDPTSSADPNFPILLERLVRALSSCATEAELVQVLYAELHSVFGYDSINLQVLEREGWYHSLAIDRGVLQDVRRRLLVESFFADCYRDPIARVVQPPAPATHLRGRGPGIARRPRALIWVPVMHGGRPVGSVSYQLYNRREIAPEEVALLEAVHAHLGPLVSNAYLIELTRNQAVSLGALDAIARALSATHDEEGVVTALMSTLSALIPVDRLELVVRVDLSGSRLRLLEASVGRIKRSWVSVGSRRLHRVRQVLDSGKGYVEEDRGPGATYRSSAVVPIDEGGALAIHARNADAYEASTLSFLQYVAGLLMLALRTTRFGEAVERDGNGTATRSTVDHHNNRLAVFLCHASSDKAVARDLHARLVRDGYRPWLDEEDLLPGQEWDAEIRKAIRKCHAMIVCLSQQSISKTGYVQKEIKLGLDVADEQPEGAIYLIPLRLQPCDVPLRLRRWQWVDLFSRGGYDRLLRTLRHVNERHHGTPDIH